MNFWLCPDCFRNWYQDAEHFEEDLAYEEKKYRPIGNSLRQPNRKNKNEPIKILHIKNDMKARLRKTGEVVELRQYYCDGTAKGVNGEYYHQGDISELFEDIDYKRLEYEFNQLGRTEKCEFISQHIELASSKAIAKYVKSTF